MNHRSLPKPARLMALPLALLLAATAVAQPVAPISPSAAAAPADPVEALGRYLRVLAVFPTNVDALTGAGRSALAIGDVNAAISFFSRAEKVAPNDGRIKAGLASALVQMEQPKRALDLFGQAVALGVPEAEIASDRGLARDLSGDTRRAQQDYALSLRSRPDDETTRRLAVSQAISGDKVAAMATLDPLLRKQDRAAWRVRAFVQALTGDQAGAEQTALATMPRPQAQAMTPFFGRLASLQPGQKAAAVNLGQLPSDGRAASNPELFAAAEVAARPAPQPPMRRPDAPLMPTGTPFGTRAAASASAFAGAPGPGSNEPQTGTSTLTRTATETGTSTRTGTMTLTRTETVPLPPAPVRQAFAAPVSRPTSTAPSELSVERLTSPGRPAAVPMAQTAMSRPGAPASVMPAALAPAVTAPAATSPVLAQAATPLPAPASAAPSLSLAATASAAATPSEQPPAVRPVDLPASRAAEAAPVGDTSLVPAGSSGPLRVPEPSSAPAARPAVEVAQPTRTVPVEQQAARPTPVRERFARVEDKPAPTRGKAKAAEEDGGSERAADGKQLASNEEHAGRRDKANGRNGKGSAKDKEEASTRTDRAGTRTAKEDAKGKSTKDKDEGKTRTAAKDDGKTKSGAKGKGDDRGTAKERSADSGSGGDRYWVQVASGSNKADLGKAWDRTKAKAPKLLEGRTTWTTPWKASNRLMVGPFKSEDEAQGFVNQLGKAGMGGMQVTTHSRTKVERLAGQ